MERDVLLKQADHMWKMLDNMAENNPEGYQRFIKKQLQEGSAHFKPPEPVFCLSCEIDKVVISTCAMLYINVCQWSQVPKPKTDNDAIPVKGGVVRKHDSTTQVYDVAFNPDVIKECEREGVNEQLVQLVLDYANDMTKLMLKRSTCKRLDKKFVGSLQEVISSIDERQRSSMHDSNIETNHPQSLLDQLANINKETEQEPDIVLPDELSVSSNKRLIEEILPCDKKALSYCLDTRNGNLSVVIQVGYNTESITEAELDVSETELELKIPGIPDHLLVKLPSVVDIDSVVAKYQPKTGELHVTMACKQN